MHTIHLIRQWYVHCFLRHFLVYLPLPLMLVFLAALLTHVLGTDFGVDKLLWHEDSLRQFFCGVGICLTVVAVLYVGYLLWHRDRDRNPDLFPDDVRVDDFTTYAWVILGSLLATGLVVAAGGGILVTVVHELNEATVPKVTASTTPPSSEPLSIHRSPYELRIWDHYEAIK